MILFKFCDWYKQLRYLLSKYFWANQSLWWLDSTDHSLVVQGVGVPSFEGKGVGYAIPGKTVTGPKAYLLLPLRRGPVWDIWEHFVKIYYLEKTNQ